MTAYEALSAMYDDLTHNIDYEKRCRYIKSVFKQNSIKGIVLDAGCGTGTLTLLLSECGFDMIGVDISNAMLNCAYIKSAESGCDIRWLNQDLCKLDLYGTVVGITCMQDTINHIENEQKLDEVFRRFSLFMEKGGVIIFDYNTEYKHRDILADNVFVFESEQGFCVWQNEFQPQKNRVMLTVDVFEKNESVYTRKTDVFFEYTYQPNHIEELLTKHGFEVIESIDGEEYTPIHSKTQRIITSARKIV
ncbi:MAG: class I SAM-dependent methyltransferase [Oscillospiraceae bacterium]